MQLRDLVMGAMNESAEIVTGQKRLEILEAISEAKCYCRIEIPQTEYSGITLILGLQAANNSNHLLIDEMTGFDDALLHSQDKEISIEFLEPGRIPCQFTTRVLQCRPEAILAELPQSIYRMQKRRYFRVKAGLGTVIGFHLHKEGEEKAVVRDYGLGGLAFFVGRHLKLIAGDQLQKIELKIPITNEVAIFHIPIAIVRRIETQTDGKRICGLEFLDMSHATKEQLRQHIFREERLMLQRVKRGLTKYG